MPVDIMLVFGVLLCGIKVDKAAAAPFVTYLKLLYGWWHGARLCRSKSFFIIQFASTRDFGWLSHLLLPICPPPVFVWRHGL